MVDDRIQSFAANAYLLLPIFLAAIAGLCILIATLRKTLDGVTAASLAALGVAVVVAHAAMTVRQSAPPPPPYSPPPWAAAPDEVAKVKALVQQRESEIEMLHETIAKLKEELAARRAHGPVEVPAEAVKPVGEAPKPAAEAPKPAPEAPKPPPEEPKKASSDPQ